MNRGSDLLRAWGGYRGKNAIRLEAKIDNDRQADVEQPQGRIEQLVALANVDPASNRIAKVGEWRGERQMKKPLKHCVPEA